MRIRLICVGHLKESYFKAASAEYEKRLSRFHRLEIVELSEEQKSDAPSESEIRRSLKAEGEKIEKAIGKNAYVIALAIDGKALSSEELSDTLCRLDSCGRTEIDFIIGSSYGICDEVLRRADLLISFSRMTFTYQLFRVIFLEQLYRASKISAGETYHK